MLNRRQFLKAASSTACLLAAPAILRARNLNSRLQVAGIGCEAQGWSDIHQVSTHPKAHFSAFCDIDLRRMKNVQNLNPEAPRFQDYREMLANHGDQIDAVVVSTPDHMHAKISVDALRKGKHVYCQKPLSHQVWESQVMVEEARKAGVITRMGNQIHSHQAYRTAARLLQEQVLGKVHQVYSWTRATGHGKSFHLDRPAQTFEVPKEVNWDLWIGVAPMRPYGGENVYHPWGWRDWQDFGNGAIGDMACHILDPVFTGLDINTLPLTVQAHSTGLNKEVWPAQTTVNYTFAPNKFTTDAPLQITWMDGGLKPDGKSPHLPANHNLPGSGSLIIGEKGSMVLPHWSVPQLYPADQFATPYELEKSLNHYHGWVDGCLTNEQPSDDFEYGARLSQTALLGNIAIRYPNVQLNWDETALRFTNHDDANQWVKRDYRTGWEL